MQLIIRCLTQNYFNFKGRSTRKEYWLFSLFTFAGLLFLVVADIMFLNKAHSVLSVISVIFLIGTVLPSLSVGVRRLHDINQRGLWLLVGPVPLIGDILLIIVFCKKGTRGPNRFGDDPMASQMPIAG